MEKPYFTTIVAFSTPSGRLHVGHALGQVAGDTAARYAELQGKKSFFPFGIHSTGKDLIRIINEIEPCKENYSMKRKNYGLSDEEASKVLSAGREEDKVKVLIEHYKAKYEKDLTSLGINLDMDSFFATDETTFHKYTQWTMKKLAERGLIVKTKSPRPYCPKCDDIKAIEHDFSEVIPQGKFAIEDVRIQEGNLLFFRNQNRIVPVYTTRPETIFGATNLYFNPNKTYIEAEIGEQKILSEETNLEDLICSLYKNTIIKTKKKILDLQEQTFFNPLTGEEVPMIPAPFVKSDIGTGIVMSVPIHDPFDYFFLRNIAPELINRAKTVINDSAGNSISFDAKEISEENLEVQRKLTYELQEQAIMSEQCGPYAGMSVPNAREQLMKDAQEKKFGGKIYKILGGNFFCRLHNDQKILIKVSEENAINYSNLEYQQKTKQRMDSMKLFPLKYRQELEEIINTRKAKPCERKAAHNVGAPSPFTAGKKIEALADSNIYIWNIMDLHQH